ncbi:MAG: twin-arginine translocase TatA/TatE family subunit [bacterium]|nr:twin-arginine translocase TatA/TatE family subunit [bacterium]
MRLGIGELLFIFGIILILFGPAKLPQLGKSMGEAIKNFKTGMDGNAEDTAADKGNEQ